MLGIDTNVLLRLFAPSDDADQTAAARQCVQQAAPVFVNPIVLAEFVWTLNRQYKLDRLTIAAYLMRIVEAPEFILEEPEAIGRAVHDFRSGPADFPDYLIGELNRCAGYEETVTFDRDAAKSSSFRLLKN
jgi:predicted nucleic-acid-binding protein